MRTRSQTSNGKDQRSIDDAVKSICNQLVPFGTMAAGCESAIMNPTP